MNKQSILYITPKETFYNSRKEVIKSGLLQHEELFFNDRALYTSLLIFKNATYYSKSIIIETLLKNSLYKDAFLNKEDILLEDILIKYTLMNESITHALKMLLRLKENKINNARTSKIILEFIFDRGNTDYISIKYKKKIKELILHALGTNKVLNIINDTPKGVKYLNKYIKIYKNPYDIEVLKFLFNKDFDFKSKYIVEYINIKNQFKTGKVNMRVKTILPIEVLQGFNSTYFNVYSLGILACWGNVSDKQKIQLNNAVSRNSNNNVELKIDLTKYSIYELVKFLYNKEGLSENEKEEILGIIKEKSKTLRINNGITFDEDTLVILDLSGSMEGSKENLNAPLYMAMTLSYIFDKETFIVGGENIVKDNIEYLLPKGETSLYKGLLYAAKKNKKKVVVISDGFENGVLFEDIHNKLKELGYDIDVIHYNPVYSPRNNSCKTIGDSIPTIPFRGEEDIENLKLMHLLNTNEESFKEYVRDYVFNVLANKVIS